MAAPPSATIDDLSGSWNMNKSLSDDTGPSLALQGVGWVTRNMIGLASVSLEIKHFEGPPLPADDDATVQDPCVCIDIVQSASGLTSTTERRCVDDRWRKHEDWLFGKVRGRTFWILVGDNTVGDALADDIADAEAKKYLSDGWLAEGGKFLVSYVENLDAGGGWTALQVWGFQEIGGARRHVRKLCVRKGEQKVLFRLVYDYADDEDADLV